MAISRGIKASGGTDFVNGFAILADEANTDLNTLISGVNNITITDANVTAGADIDPSKVGDYSANAAEMQAQANPLDSTTWTETGQNEPTDLEGELARIRYVLQKMSGGTYWFSRANMGITVAQTGDLKPTLRVTADTGWIMVDDGTIGNAASAATNRANADTVDLFTYLWTNYSDSICPVSGGRGATAAADYAANKTINLPLMVGRIPGVAGTPSADNITDTIALYAGSSADATHITLASGYRISDDDIINGYTLTVTSGARNGESATVTDYVASTGVITVGAGLSGALGANDTFTVHTTVPTRSAGDAVGKPDIITVSGNSSTAGSGLGGFSTLPTPERLAYMTNYPPTFFGNWMVKL